MKHTVTVSLKKENLDAVFVREILLSGSCEAILPMNLYRGKKYCFGVYHTEGFRCLGQCESFTAEQILQIAEALFHMREECRDHLLFPTDYVLNLSTLYVRRDHSELRLLYIPARKGLNPRKTLQYLLQSMKALTSPYGVEYLCALQELLQGASMKPEQIAGRLQQWRAEIRNSGIC